MATVTQDIIPPPYKTSARDIEISKVKEQPQKNEKPEKLNEVLESILSLKQVGNISKIVTKQLVYKEYDHSQEKFIRKEKLKNFDKRLFSKHIGPIVQSLVLVDRVVLGSEDGSITIVNLEVSFLENSKIRKNRLKSFLIATLIL